MIKYTPSSEYHLTLFKTPFEQSLDSDNRWVIMSSLVPWDDLASIFYKRMSRGMGRGSIDLRIVLGALLVKHLKDLSDEETISYIQENIYAQYFVGLRGFHPSPIFAPSLFVEIRKRLGLEGVQELNDKFLAHCNELGAIKHRKKWTKKEETENKGKEEEIDSTKEESVEEGKGESENIEEQENTDETTKNRGTLKVDATVAPQYISYPTDTALLAKGRELSEELIDKLFSGSKRWSTKPRTYRREAAQKYNDFSKKRRPRSKAIKQCRKEQLNYLRRNIKSINTMLDELKNSEVSWSHKDWRTLWIITELHRQQRFMHQNKKKKIEDRIVSLHQPHVRPIKRGKSGKRDTEFGSKLNISETEGFVRLDQASFNNFNESKYLEEQLEAYKLLYGHYPELVLADKIYLTNKNRNLLKSKGIRHAGTPLGRPPKLSPEQKRKRKKEQDGRNTIEGKFGQAKTTYGLDNVKTTTVDTSFAAIGLILLAMNLVRLHKDFACLFQVFLSYFIWPLSSTKYGLGRLFLLYNNPKLIYC